MIVIHVSGCRCHSDINKQMPGKEQTPDDSITYLRRQGKEGRDRHKVSSMALASRVGGRQSVSQSCVQLKRVLVWQSRLILCPCSAERHWCTVALSDASVTPALCDRLAIVAVRTAACSQAVLRDTCVRRPCVIFGGDLYAVTFK